MRAHHVQQVLALEDHLDKHDALLRESKAVYKAYAKDAIEDLEFQRKLVQQALGAKRRWTAELATGCGKSVIAAKVAAARLSDGPVIYVSPSAASIGDIEGGIINQFSRVLRAAGQESRWLGRVNDLSRANDVSFVTPRAFVSALERNPQEAERLLRRASCLIVDEAHHFPDDPDEDLAVYGALHRAAEEHVRDGLTVALTGTWHRLDGKRPMGTRVPDARLTVQDVVNLGRCPELYGVQVITEVRARKAMSRGDLYDFHLTGEERIKYLQGVAECMLTTWRRYPVPFAGFACTVADAVAIASRFNTMARRTEANGLIVLTSRTPLPQRLDAVRDIAAGRRCGYITCAVGEEAIDIPALEVVHLVRRTRSLARNQQAIGRALRVHLKKRRALVVDYQTMLEGVRDRFLGLGCDDLVEPTGSEIPRERLVNGGPICVQRDYPQAVLVGMTMAEERALVCVDRSYKAQKKNELRQLAESGAPRPKPHTTLGVALRNYTGPAGHSYDAEFTRQIYDLRPDWRGQRDKSDETKELLLARARRGDPQPLPSNGEAMLNRALRRYTNAGMCYDAAFHAELVRIAPRWFTRTTVAEFRADILKRAPSMKTPKGLERRRIYNSVKVCPEFGQALRELRPDWFTDKEAIRARIADAKQELLALAENSGKRPSGHNKKALAFRRYACDQQRPEYDATLARKLRTLRPDWFVTPNELYKRELLDLARTGAPRPGSNNPNLYARYWNYVTKGRKGFDAKFRAKILSLRPDWALRKLKNTRRKAKP